MKKLTFLILSLLFCLPAEAATTAMVPPAAAYTAQSPNFLMFTGALGFGLMVEYLDAEGISFPACQDKWLTTPQHGTKCYNDYPEAVHKDGV